MITKLNAPARNVTTETQDIILLQPLPLTGIQFIEFSNDILYLIKNGQLFSIKNPLSNSLISKEPSFDDAVPEFLFQRQLTPHVIFSSAGMRSLWRKETTGKWEYLCHWPGAIPRTYAETGTESVIFLDTHDMSASGTLYILTGDNQVIQIPSGLIPGKIRNIKLFNNNLIIGTFEPNAIFSCPLDDLNSCIDGNSQDIQFKKLETVPYLQYCNILDRDDGLALAVNGPSKIINVKGEAIFNDTEQAACGYQIAAAAKLKLNSNWHIIGSWRRDTGHPNSCLYILDANLKSKWKLRKGNLGPIKPWTGYLLRNRGPNLNKFAIANTAGWPVIVSGYRSPVAFAEENFSDFLKLEYADASLAIYSRDHAQLVLPQTTIMQTGLNNSHQICHEYIPPELRKGDWPFSKIETMEPDGTIKKSFDQYPRFNLDFKDMDGYTFAAYWPIIYTINHNGVKFDMLLARKYPSKKVVIFGNGYINKQRLALPFFQRAKWIDDIDANCIFYFDPSLYEGESELCWCYGHNERWYLQDIHDLIAIILKKWNINPAGVLHFGSSGGGYTSLALATLGHAQALAINPQLDIKSYYKRHYESFIKTCIKSGEKPILERTNIIELIKKEKFFPKCTIWMNVANVHHRDAHLYPFLNQCEQINYIGNNLNVMFYYNEEGHAGMPNKDLQLKVIHSLLAG